MSIKVATLNVSAVTVGQRLSAIDWSAFIPNRSQAMLDDSPGSYGYLRIINESGCGLDLSFNGGSGERFAKAGGEPLFELRSGDTSATPTVNYIMAGQLVSTVIALYYRPGEPVDVSGTIGNSPVGGAVSVAIGQDLDQYLVGQGILTGLVASADGVVLNQLDVTSGVAFIKQLNNANEPVAFATATYLTANPNATYFLDLNPDGTVSWGMAHSTQTNAFQYVTVTTDGSSNISAVVPANKYNLITFLPALTGILGFAPQAQSIQFAAPISLVGGQPTAGSFGVPFIVAQAHQVHVTSTTQQTILSFTPSVSGLYRVSAWLRINNGTSGNNVSLLANYTEGVTSTGVGTTFIASFNGNTGAATTLGGAASVANNFFTCFPLVIDASSSGNIQIVYHDPTNTPSDFVDVIIERLS